MGGDVAPAFVWGYRRRRLFRDLGTPIRLKLPYDAQPFGGLPGGAFEVPVFDVPISSSQ